jgi:hypothetical protein
VAFEFALGKSRKTQSGRATSSSGANFGLDSEQDVSENPPQHFGITGNGENMWKNIDAQEYIDKRGLHGMGKLSI